MKLSLENGAITGARIALLVVTALTMSVAESGCNSNSSPSKATQTDQSPAWALNYQANCTGADQADCAGAYGLTINADGSYQVGPGPKGELLKGKIEPQDFASLTDLISGTVSGTAILNAESCNGDFSQATDYTLTLIKHGIKKEVLHKAGANLCSNRLESQPAENLHNAIIAAVEKYYAVPFPDACLEAASDVESLYPAVEKCSADTDCGYLDLNYQAIPAQGESTVYLDNCSVVKTLPTANIVATHQNLATLQAALDKAQTLCGARIVRDNCSGINSFSSSAAPAVCTHGFCQVNPTLVH